MWLAERNGSRFRAHKRRASLSIGPVNLASEPTAADFRASGYADVARYVSQLRQRHGLGVGFPYDGHPRYRRNRPFIVSRFDSASPPFDDAAVEILLGFGIDSASPLHETRIRS